MAFRTLRRRCSKLNTLPAKHLTLEQLESRLLLTASVGDWLDVDINDFIRPGYGHPDAFFSDPMGELTDPDDLAAVLDFFENEHSHDIDTDVSVLEASASGYTLFLDFDGSRVYSRSGDFYLGASYVDVPAYNLSQFGWGGQESQSISYITQFVQEDYAAYNIQVTNTQPTSGEYTTIYVGGDNSWFSGGSSVIGVATYDVGNTDASNYGFAFTEELGIYAQYSYGSMLAFSEYVANLISHEAAHTYGANHVSDATCMMNPYLPLSPRVQSFGRGRIPGSTQIQDTQSQMGTNIGYATPGGDDYGDSRTTASTVTTGSTINGLLERRDDVDAFKFTAGQTGELTIDIDTSIYSNLDSYLQIVRTSDGTVIAENDDLQGTDSGVTINTTAGTSYTVLIGSSNSASSGSYTLSFDAGPQSADITVTDSSGSPTDHSIAFGNVTVGDSLNATITITNDGFGELVISRLTAGGCFSLNHTSQASNSGDDITLAPGDELTVIVTYEPDGLGSDSGTITLQSNDPDESSLAITLTGQGVAPEPGIVVSGDGSFSGTTLDFGNVSRGRQATETIIITNDGDSTLIIENVAMSEPFVIVSGFSGSPLNIAPGQQSVIVLGVESDERQDLDGVLLIVSNDPDDPIATFTLDAQIVGGEMTVTETAQTPNDGAIGFGNVYVGDAPTRTVTISNTGDGDLTISALDIDSVFSTTIICTSGNGGDDITLEPGESLLVTIAFTPTLPLAYTGNLVIAGDDLENDEVVITLTGQGVDGALSVSEADGTNDGLIAAGSVNLAANTVLDVWRLTNNSLTPITVSLSLEDGNDFELVGDNLITLSAGEEVTVSVRVTTEFACTVSDRLMLIADDGEQTYQAANLSADAYALLGQGQSYRFTDHSGDTVRVMLMGDALARLTIGQALEPDIAAINFIGGESGTLMILTGSGRTQLGDVTGAVDLSMIMASKVDVVGNFNLDGTIGNAMLGNISGATMNFASTSRTMLRAGAITNSNIDISGTLGMLFAGGIDGGSFQADTIGRVMLSGDFNGNLTITHGDLDSFMMQKGDFSGNVNVSNGNLDSLMVMGGDMAGTVRVGETLDRMMLLGGVFSGSVHADDAVNMVMARDFDQASLTAMTDIGRVIVFNDMLDSLVAAGYDPDLELEDYAAAVPSVNAHLGSLSVNGTFRGSTVASGVAPDAGGDFIHGLGIANLGMVGSITLRNVETDNNARPFGVVAQDNVDRLLVNSQSVNDAFQQNDFYVNILRG